MREWLLRLIMVAVSLLVGLTGAELAVRIIHPISDGRDNVTMDGVPITAWFDPGSVYRQVSNEYDVRTTITNQGHRVPGTDGNPDVVFIGDSFTYGWGIEDADTFVSIYCARTGRACVNLGAPGTGTAKQLNRLEEFLDKYQWRPKEVRLVFFGMSGAWSAGNDFVDNYDERGIVEAAGGTDDHAAVVHAQGASMVPPAAAPSPRTPAASPRIGFAERLIGLQSLILGRSNLVRLAKFYWGPMLKSLIVADPGQERLKQALYYTGENLKRLDRISRARGFTYSIYLIVPVQDIIRDGYPQTLQALNRVSPKPAVSTAHLFVDNPTSYYYSYDGHINARGSRRIGEFLVGLEQAASDGRGQM